MQRPSQTKAKEIKWPDLAELLPLSELPYQHAKLNVLEIESRVLNRYLRNKRKSEQIRERLTAFKPGLSRFLDAGGLASAMYRIRPSESRLAEEHLYYQDLAPELNKLIYEAFQGLLGQDQLFDLAQELGKGSILALHNLNQLNLEQEHPRAKAEYRLVRAFRDQYFPTLRRERMASLNWHVPDTLFYEPDYTAIDLPWIDNVLFDPLIKERKLLALDQGFDHFSTLAKRRIGMLGELTEDLTAIRDAIVKWLVPIAGRSRSLRSLEKGQELVNLYPTAAATVTLQTDLPAPLRATDLMELEQFWGRPHAADSLENRRNPLNKEVVGIIAKILGDPAAQYFNRLQAQGYIRESLAEHKTAFYLPEEGVPFIAMGSMRETVNIPSSVALLGYGMAMQAGSHEEMLMLRYPAADYQSAQAWGLLGLSLTRLAAAFPTEDEGVRVRDALLLKLLNELIYTAMLEEFQDFCYSEETNPAMRNEFWLTLMERWYPDLADNHEWLLIQEESWRLIPALVLCPYHNAAEFSSRLTTLQLWDKSRYAAKEATNMYLKLIAGKRSDSLAESLHRSGLKPVDDIDTIKRLAYQLADSLSY